MARGSFRKKRERVLEELREIDPVWADQLAALRSTNPQAFRKGVLKADVMIAARTGRATILGMRPKRYGGEEDAALVRRVQELRRHYRSIEPGFALPPLQRKGHGDGGAAPAGRQGLASPTPPAGDAPPAVGDRANRRASPIVGDAPPASGGRPGLRGAAPTLGDAPPASGGRPGLRGAAPTPGDASPASGGRANQRASSTLGDAGRGAGAEPGLGGSAGSDAPARVDLGGGPRAVSAPQRAAPAPPDLDDVLAGSVADIKRRVDAGELDAWLGALGDRERAGKGRKGVLKAIEARS